MVGTDANSRDRGQIILIGAITLAFIVLGIVVVFNGILYTEGLSSGTSSQAATDTEISEAEIRQGIGCLLVETNERSAWEDETDPSKEHVRSEIKGNINEFSESYRDVKSQSSPSVITLEYDNDEISENEEGQYEIDSITVTVTYDSHDFRYNTELEIEPSDCPNPGETES